MERRIVITGIGVVSSIGRGREKFWNALIGGKSGISPITSFDTSQYPTHNAGEIKDFHPQVKLQGRTSSLAIAASRLALEDSGINLKTIDPQRIGVNIGTTMGESGILEILNEALVRRGEQALDTALIPHSSACVLSANIAIEFQLKGPNMVIPTACAAGNYAIGYAFDLLKKGRVDIMFAGGADAFSRLAFIGFNRLLAVAPEKCQPFDKNRKGMLVGEGAGIVIMEPLDKALERKAEIYAEVLGYGLSCDAHHMTAPDADGIARAVKKAMQEAGIGPQDVDYISAHGTGTLANDKIECLAIKKVFGELAGKIPMSSIKSMLGHTMGAASAIEAIACALAVKTDTLPPTINYETPDPECDIDCIPGACRRRKTDIALNNASAFGGNNACLVLKKFL